MATVIFDGQRGLLPVSLLQPADLKVSKGKNKDSVPSGIPLPPELRPPARPRSHPSVAAPSQGYATSDTPPPSYASATEAAPRRSAAVSPPRGQGPGGAAERDSVVVKVHYTYTLALSVPLDTSVHDLKQQIGQKLGQSASVLRLRQKQHGSRALVPVNDTEGSEVTVQEVAQAGRATLWCQTEDPLENRPILYQVVALYDYAAQGPEDLEFSEGDTIDILGEVNEEWLEGHCAGGIGIFPRCFAYRENFADTVVSQL
eukprot:XP_011618982.1 PREDICTED: neutrophil cytosol factor 2-like [Takifugu rubripes]